MREDHQCMLVLQADLHLFFGLNFNKEGCISQITLGLFAKSNNLNKDIIFQLVHCVTFLANNEYTCLPLQACTETKQNWCPDNKHLINK